MVDTVVRPGVGRRQFLKAVGASAVLASGGLAAACGSGSADAGPAGPIRIGYVSPQTGPLAPFGESDQFVIESARAHFADHPIVVGGRSHPVEILSRDSQSSPTRAADMAADLIRNAGIHLMLVSSTPDTTNPVSDQCEADGMPCVATVVPWQSWFLARGGQPNTGFKWTFMFFLGLEDVEAIYADMWDSVPTNKVVGGLFPADSDGLSWGDPARGFPAFIASRGYRSVDPGAFPIGTQDFTTHIEKFKAEKVEIVTGVPTPVDFATFWRQAAQKGYRPKLVTVAKAIEFPSAVEALGPALADKIGTEVWWSPSHPYSSSLTGQSSQQLADAFTAATGKQWAMPLGYAHTLIEVAAKAFSSVAAVDDRQGLADAIRRMKIDSIVGPLDWTTGPVPGVAKTPLVGAQWRATSGGKFPFEIVIVNNRQFPNIPTGGELLTL